MIVYLAATCQELGPRTQCATRLGTAQFYCFSMGCPFRIRILCVAISLIATIASLHCRRHCHVRCRFRGASAPDGQSAEEGSLRDRRDPAARPCAEEHVCLGHPPRAPRAARAVHAARGRAHAYDRRGRGAGPRDGGGRQLQRRLGGAGHPDLALRRAQAAVPYRRLRRLGHRVGGRRQGEALEGRRRGRHPLQPGRRRRRGVQRRRSDVLHQPAHLGLRDAGRLVRPVLPGAGAPAHEARRSI